MNSVKVLVTSSAMISHFAPLVPFIEALRDSDHDVLLLAPGDVVERAAQLGVPTITGGSPDPGELDELWQRFRVAPRSEASVIANREIFARLNTAAMLPAVEAAVRDYHPDFVLHEVTEYAGPAVATTMDIPHAQVAISGSEAEAGSVRIAEPVLAQHRQLVGALHAAPFLTRFPAAIDPSPYPDTRRYREPSEPAGALPDWWNGGPGPLVYVTFGTVAGSVDPDIYRTALDAVAGLPVRVLVTTGQQTDIGPVPDNVVVRTWVEQDQVLAHVALVLCHGGSGTTLGALAAGVPMVIFPMFADQRNNATALEKIGVARVVEPPGESAAERAGGGRDAVPAMRSAIRAALADDTMRARAARHARTQASLPTPADLLDGLLGARPGGR